MRKFISAAFALVAAAAVVFGTTGAAQASPRASAPSASAPSASAVTVVATSKAGMTLDCASMSASALSYAVKHHYCTSGPHPQNTVTGNCGSSYITIVGSGGGYAHIFYGFGSTNGTVVYRNLHVSWNGLLAQSGWTDSGTMWNANYAAANIIYPGAPGWAGAFLTGSVALWWGGTCTLEMPTDLEYINP